MLWGMGILTKEYIVCVSKYLFIYLFIKKY